MPKQSHQPERFQVFSELKDGSGFTIPGTKHIFKFDRHGGWFDEYGNYYNSNGSPEDPPSDEEPDNGEDYRSNDSYSDEDQFQKQFGGPKDVDFEEEDTVNIIHLQRIALNIDALNSYPCNEAFRVHFRNFGYYSKKNEVFNYFKNLVPGIINVIFSQNEKGQFNGCGYFIVDNIKSGEGLIRLEGEKYGDRQIRFSLENVQAFLLDPLKPNELAQNFNQLFKTFIHKGPVLHKQEIKKQQVKEVKNQVKIETKKVEAQIEALKITEKKIEQPKFKPAQLKKPQNLQQFLQYKFIKQAFPKKSSFKQWMIENNINTGDYQNVEKIQTDLKYAKITMKRKVYQKLNNSSYNGVKIVFTPL